MQLQQKRSAGFVLLLFFIIISPNKEWKEGEDKEASAAVTQPKFLMSFPIQLLITAAGVVDLVRYLYPFMSSGLVSRHFTERHRKFPRTFVQLNRCWTCCVYYSLFQIIIISHFKNLEESRHLKFD